MYGLRRRPRTGRTLNEAHISRVGLRHRKIQERKESQKFKGRGRCTSKEWSVVLRDGQRPIVPIGSATRGSLVSQCEQFHLSDEDGNQNTQGSEVSGSRGHHDSGT